MGLFSNKIVRAASVSSDFAYIADGVHYFDSACQSLRPECVIDAEASYYRTFNACGGRVKYGWGAKTDEEVEATRRALLAYVGKNEKEYAVAFTLNTTYGINLVLGQLPANTYETIVTSESEHNSVLLPTIAWAKKWNKKRTLLTRADDGTVGLQGADLKKAVVLLSTFSNIDGRGLPNIAEVEKSVHANGGILLLDCAQQFAHGAESIRNIDFDAAFGSAHKMYAPSLGFIIIKRTLLRSLTPEWIGGGTVADVDGDTFVLQSGTEEHAVLEPGLQNWAGIVGLGAALRWLKTVRSQEQELAESLFQKLRAMPRVTLINSKPSTVISLYVKGLDAHKIALLLSEKNIMCRSGHFCCHHYLQHVRNLPPLLRISLGLHSTALDIEKLCEALTVILSVL